MMSIKIRKSFVMTCVTLTLYYVFLHMLSSVFKIYNTLGSVEDLFLFYAKDFYAGYGMCY